MSAAWMSALTKGLVGGNLATGQHLIGDNQPGVHLWRAGGIPTHPQPDLRDDVVS